MAGLIGASAFGQQPFPSYDKSRPMGGMRSAPGTTVPTKASPSPSSKPYFVKEGDAFLGAGVPERNRVTKAAASGPVAAPVAAVGTSEPVVFPLPKRDGPMPKQIPPEVTQLPPRASIFQMADDAALQRGIINSVAKDLKKKPDDPTMLPFPPLKPVVPEGTPYVAKTAYLPQGVTVFEPGFVVHRRLHFEEKNSERYGWDLGIFQPLVSVGSFYKNTLLWPSSLATGAVVGFWDTNAGKCLPGSPTPYILYPQGLTVTGTTVEGLVVTGFSFIIP